MAVVALSGGIYVGVGLWRDHSARQAAEKQELEAMRQKAFKLYDEYKACNTKLRADYPQGRTEANKAAYDQSSKHCAAIETEQNAVAKEYNTRAGVR